MGDAIGVDPCLDQTLEHLEGRDRCGQLHPAVGGVGFAAADLLLDPGEAEQRSPAARPQIAVARAVCIDLDKSEIRPRHHHLFSEKPLVSSGR